ncbi:MAG: tRNA uridine-5-carboxymethylaminomethyl(34) synthesis GTPase MnmE, partial [Chlorobi bacterium]|nr:tRNA uridine-5-carboxymethylaminomethyl(34) synthesis GTPase MnmE [Chlorobiota bacterium]
MALNSIMAKKPGKTIVVGSERTVPALFPGDVDTIAAIATPPGTGGIAVIRVSGPAALELAARVFRGADLLTVAPRTAHFCRVIDEGGNVVDEVVATVFHRPSSYTGEDTVELSCHGGRAVAAAVLEAVLRGGGRHAVPGEFTKRAFLNGRIDLVQAEAVADLIHAETRQAQKASIVQLEGRLSGFVREVREKLLRTAAVLELSLDFAEDDVPLAEPVEHRRNLEESMQAITTLIKSYDSGRVVREGIKVVIIGRPNAGKSSLLNALLGMPRAIVTPVPGTTRDYLEEAAVVDGTLFRFVDTAGLRDTNDLVEREGIARTIAQVQDADIIVDVVDVTSGPDAETILREERQWLSDVVSSGVITCIALNKIDLGPGMKA